MRTWTLGTNDFYYTSSIHLMEVNCILYHLRNILMCICDLLYYIPVPCIKFRLRNLKYWEYTENEDGWTDTKEWYGYLGGIFHLYVCDPFFQYVERKSKSAIFEIPYALADLELTWEFYRNFPRDEIGDNIDDWSEEEEKERYKNFDRAGDFYREYIKLMEKYK